MYEVSSSSEIIILDGQVVRGSASRPVDSGLIPNPIKPMTIKSVFTASLLDAVLCIKGQCGNKLASLLVVSLRKALNGILPS